MSSFVIYFLGDIICTRKYAEASHRKLLLQVEGAIESQISDAETRVATLHKVSSLNSCSN